MIEEYVVVRNAGGRAEPAVRDIAVLSAMAKITDVVIVHHVGMDSEPLKCQYFLEKC